MSIANLDRYILSLWDWGFLDQCFAPSRSRVGDIDGIIEHCNQILLIEGKPMRLAPSVGEQWRSQESRSNGQARLWRGLVNRGISVLLLWGEPADPACPMKKTPQRMQLWFRNRLEPEPVEEASIEIVQRRVRGWWLWAEEADRPPSPVGIKLTELEMMEFARETLK